MSGKLSTGIPSTRRKGEIATSLAWAVLLALVFFVHGIAPPKGWVQPWGKSVVFKTHESIPRAHQTPNHEGVEVQVRFDPVGEDWVGSAFFVLILAAATRRGMAVFVACSVLGIIQCWQGWTRLLGFERYVLWWFSILAMGVVGAQLGKVIAKFFLRHLSRFREVARVVLFAGLSSLMFVGAMIQGGVISMFTDLKLLGVESSGMEWVSERFLQFTAGLGSVVATLFVGDPQWFFICILLWPFTGALTYLVRGYGRGRDCWILAVLLLTLELSGYFFWPRVGAAFAGLGGGRASISAGFVELGTERARDLIGVSLSPALARPEVWRGLYGVSFFVAPGVVLLSLRSKRDPAGKGDVASRKHGIR